ncbi:hypothetical protein BT69DRAFT_1295483 [Atractiella rhizophila]|nr:hypothetical protein BT69DRAFT_1295483 [Atractiella rhizophila]
MDIFLVPCFFFSTHQNKPDANVVSPLMIQLRLSLRPDLRGDINLLASGSYFSDIDDMFVLEEHFQFHPLHMPPTRERACPALPAGFDTTSSSTSWPKQKNQYSVKQISAEGETEGNSLMLINAELAKMKENSISKLKGVKIFKAVLGTKQTSLGNCFQISGVGYFFLIYVNR